ncbi:MAG: extracellular solute-binding protein [Oscillospiraceae bacterium]|nr:extracellular solute-binding protein [Oscillospiraceae bacterium]
MKKGKKMTRVMGFVLALMMVLGLLSGCGGNGGSQSSGKKLTIGIPQSGMVTDYYDNSFTKYIEEKLGAEVEFVLFSRASEAMNQLALMCAAGDELPDVLVGFSNMSGSLMYEYGQDGFFIDLKDLIDQYGTEFKKHMEALPQDEYDRVMDFITKPDTGAIYGLPTYAAVDTDDYVQNLMFINEQWLNELNLEAPTNIDELYDVLVAFRDEDPNNNGRADELPMLSPAIYYWVINAFVYFDSVNPYNITDGKVWAPTMSEEYRQALAYLRKLYSEGLIKFDSPAADAKNTISGDGTTARVGIWCGYPTTSLNHSSQVLDQYVVLAPLADETGKGGYLVERPNDLLLTGHITKDCKDPELAMRFLDICYEDGSVTRRRWGEEGTNWVWVDEAEPNNYGGLSHIKVLNSDLFGSNNVTWGSFLPNIYTDENYLVIASTVPGFDKENSRLCTAQVELARTWRQPTEKVTSLKLTLEERAERETINGKYTTTLSQYFGLFLSGKLDSSKDADWNKFVSDLEACGVTRLVEIYQAAYDRQ